PEKDGVSRQPAFLHRWDRPFDWKLRQVKGTWRLDAHAETGMRRPADYLVPAAGLYPSDASFKEQLLADLQSGKLQTAEQATQAYDAGWEALLARDKDEKEKHPLNPVDACFFAAWKTTQRWVREYYTGREGLYGLHRWSNRLREAEGERGGQKA